METENNDLDDFLSQEEKDLLAKIQNKIKEKFESAMESKYDHIPDDAPLDLSEQHPEIIEPQHITENPHEIKVGLTVEVSEVDEKGFLKETKQLTKKNYHIPVPSKQDYTTYVDTFVNNFEKKLAESCHETFPKKDYNG